MTEVLTLIQRTVSYEDLANPVTTETTRWVFAEIRSVTRTEFYQAQAANIQPELVFVLADYLEYNGELLVEHEGLRYRVIRTYRTGQELELVVRRASVEEGGTNG